MSEDILKELDAPKDTNSVLDSYDHVYTSDRQTLHYQEREWPEYHEFPNKDFIG